MASRSCGRGSIFQSTRHVGEDLYITLASWMGQRLVGIRLKASLTWRNFSVGTRKPRRTDRCQRGLRQESTQEMRDAVHVSRLQKAAGSYMTLYIRGPSTAGGTLPASSGARRPVFYTEIPRYDERRLFSVLWRTMPDVEEIRVLVGSESARAALPKVVVAAAIGLATSPGRIGVLMPVGGCGFVPGRATGLSK